MTVHASFTCSHSPLGLYSPICVGPTVLDDAMEGSASRILYCVRGVRVDSERSRPSQLWAVVNDNVSGLVLNILAVARHLVDFNGAGKITKAEAGTMSAPLKLRPYGAIQICLLLLFFRR